MEAATILVLFIIFLFFEYICEAGLTLLNISHIRRRADVIPASFAGYVDAQAAHKAAEYSIVKGKFSLIASGVSTLILFVLVVSGLLGWVDTVIGSLGLSLYLHGILYIAIVSVVFSLTNLPFSIYNQFVIEERFGFNTMTPRLFFLDRLKSLLLSLIIGVPLLLGLFFFMETTGRWWWLFAFGFFTLFQIVVSLLYPAFIAPLFNKFTPLPEGSLKEKIQTLLQSLDFRVKGIFIMDGSRRSRHGNAYFTGLGRTKRIVFFDTLLKTLDEDELTAVFAHELGHEKRGHLFINMVMSILLSGVMFFVLSLLLPYRPLYEAFGFAAPGYHSLIVLLGLCSGRITFFLRPLFTALSRRHEYQADRFAKDLLGGDHRFMTQALIKLHRDNLSNLHPHPLYSFINYSHPTLAERVSRLEKQPETASS